MQLMGDRVCVSPAHFQWYCSQFNGAPLKHLWDQQEGHAYQKMLLIHPTSGVAVVVLRTANGQFCAIPCQRHTKLSEHNQNISKTKLLGSFGEYVQYDVVYAPTMQRVFSKTDALNWDLFDAIWCPPPATLPCASRVDHCSQVREYHQQPLLWTHTTYQHQHSIL
jgi:hypothetical protein